MMLLEVVARMRVGMNGERVGEMGFGEVIASGKVLTSLWGRRDLNLRYQISWRLGVPGARKLQELYYVRSTRLSTESI